MPASDKKTFALWSLIACLLVINSVAIVIIIRQRAEITRQRTEAEALRAQREQLLEHAAQGNIPTLRVIPAANPGAFAGVKESDVPGRYRWFESERDRGITTLNPDHTFILEKGPKSDTYRWTLSRDQLVLEYNRMTIFYTNVEAPGIYVGVRTDKKSQRLEKVL